MKLEDLLFRRKAIMINLKQHIKKQRHDFANKEPQSQSHGFPELCGCESRTGKKVSAEE